jgi:hypothetical protein
MYSRLVIASVAVSFIGTVVGQQDGSAAKQKIVAELKSSIAKNQAALKSYAWTETTQISLKGEVKKTQQKECQYGPDGKVQKTPIGGDNASQQQQASGGGRRGGRLKKDIVEKKVGEMKDYMDRVAALVHEYAPPDPQKIQAAAAAGNVSVTPAEPVLIAIKNYLKQGDSVTLGFDRAAKKLVSYNVDSYLDDPKDDAVKLAVNFAQLPDGTNHIQQSVLDATGKKIQVNTTNSDYKKIGQ